MYFVSTIKIHNGPFLSGKLLPAKYYSALILKCLNNAIPVVSILMIHGNFHDTHENRSNLVQQIFSHL